jgi:hypothetical protein
MRIVYEDRPSEEVCTVTDALVGKRMVDATNNEEVYKKEAEKIHESLIRLRTALRVHTPGEDE